MITRHRSLLCVLCGQAQRARSAKMDLSMGHSGYTVILALLGTYISDSRNSDDDHDDDDISTAKVRRDDRDRAETKL